MLRSTPEVRQLNKERIRQQIQAHDAFTKAEVSRWTSLSLSTCNTILNEMMADGEILHVAQLGNSVGRPASRFRYNSDHLHVLAISILYECDGNAVAFAVANALGRVLRHEVRRPDEITFQVVEDLVAEQVAADELIRGISLGIPGISHQGIIERCEVASLVGVAAEQRLRDRFDVTVEVGNDMLFIANGVHNSIRHDGGNTATLYFPENRCVGCGFVIDGKPLRGHTRSAGELFYVAEGFGLSQADQIARMEQRSAFRDLAAKMVLTASCTVDPEVIMLMGNEVAQTDLDVIRGLCESVIPADHLPTMLADNDVSNHYMTGLVRVMLDLLQFPLQRA